MATFVYKRFGDWDKIEMVPNFTWMSLKKSYLILQNGFLRVSCLKCGLYPLNADEFTYMLYVNTSIKQLINAEKKKEKKRKKEKRVLECFEEKKYHGQKSHYILC